MISTVLPGAVYFQERLPIGPRVLAAFSPRRDGDRRGGPRAVGAAMFPGPLSLRALVCPPRAGRRN